MERLTKESLWSILDPLTKADLLNLSQVNKRLRQVIYSEDFARYRFGKAGYNPQQMIEVKPSQVSSFNWYYLVVEEKILEDPISIKLDLTVEQAYQRKRLYHSKFRKAGVILLEMIKQRDYASFREQLKKTRQKDMVSETQFGLFFSLSDEILFSAIFTDDPRYLRELIKLRHHRNAFRWRDIYLDWDQGWLISREVYQLLAEMFLPYRQKYPRQIRLLEEVAEGKIILDYLNQRPIQLDSTNNFSEILINLEERNPLKAAQFYREYRSILGEVELTSTRLYDYYVDAKIKPQLILPLVSMEEEVPTFEKGISIVLSNLNGIYRLIDYADQAEIYAFLSDKLNLILWHLINHDLAWDAVIYLILVFPEKHDIEMIFLEKLPLKKRKAIEAAINGERIDYWDYF